LTGLKVLDMATMQAGPMVATHLADHGADVIKIEQPTGDPMRRNGMLKNGVPLWWKLLSRNKRAITLNLRTPKGQDLLKRLAQDADVLVENFRPGTMERWNLGWETLHALNPRLVMVRTTGFGQAGPYSGRAGFGTIAEAMSGFAHITGEANGPPTLPPFALGDNIAGLFGAMATMFAIYYRDVRGAGVGQCIDLSLFEPLFSILGNQSTVYDQLGVSQNRTGNRSANVAPRNAYQTREGRWVALSASTQSIALRVLTLIGGEALANDARFHEPRSRLAHAEEVDRLVADWVRARPVDEVLRVFDEAGAAIGPVFDIAQIFENPQYQARESIVTVCDEELGPIKMQGVFPKLGLTPGRVRWSGPSLGRHNRDIYGGQLGLNEQELEGLRAEGVI
jgi:formyl-CoA transferase